MTTYGLKMMVKSCLEFFILKLYIERAPSETPANLPGQFSLSGPIFLHWAAATLKFVQFQKKICPLRLNWPGRLAGVSEGASLQTHSLL